MTPVGDVPAHCPGECRVSARGFDRIRVTVSLDNEPAQALYERCGYRDVGVDELIVPDWTMGPVARTKDTYDLFIERVGSAHR